ncbi:class I SAM-dependent methyltransferase [Pseudonocardia sp. CA-107938]|uniref:class I SAM-dependent methyltransferase n=1 Tax=Pseudonocardia sp. CA-107938 TaxID=3240021 RepID=UPI003D8E793D
MKLPSSVMRHLARQLGRPSGPVGRYVIARMLNKGNGPVVAAAVDALALQHGDVAADIGFGGGVGLPLLLDRVGPGGHVHGVDLAEDMVRQATARHRTDRLTVHLGSITDLPLDDASVDGAISINVIYFVEAADRAFAEVARVLKPGGRFVLGHADPDFMRGLPFTRHGFRIRPIELVTSLLGEAGLPVTEHQRVGDGDRAYHLLVGTRPGTPG